MANALERTKPDLPASGRRRIAVRASPVQQDAGTEAKAPVPKAEQSRRTRELIIQTGIGCLANYGYARTSMQLISQEAGISRGPLHYHFADKNDLMAAIAERIPHPIPGALSKRLAGVTDPVDRLMTLIDIASENQDGPHHLAAMELIMAARQDTELAHAIRPHIVAGESWMDDWWVDYLKASRLPRETLLALRHTAVASVRGMVLERIALGPDSRYDGSLAMFRDMMIVYLRHLMDRNS